MTEPTEFASKPRRCDSLGQSRVNGLWWTREGTNSQEVTGEVAEQLMSALEASPEAPVWFRYHMANEYPFNFIDQIEIVS